MMLYSLTLQELSQLRQVDAATVGSSCMMRETTSTLFCHRCQIQAVQIPELPSRVLRSPIASTITQHA